MPGEGDKLVDKGDKGDKGHEVELQKTEGYVESPVATTSKDTPKDTDNVKEDEKENKEEKQQEKKKDSFVQDLPGLDYDEMSNLLRIDLDINAKNMHMNMDYDPEPILKIDIIVKMTFFSFESAMLIKEHKKDSLDYTLDKFGMYRHPTPPKIDNVSGTGIDSTPPFIKKSFIPKKEERKRLEALGKKAFGAKCYEHYEFKPSKWVLTQRFKVDLGQPAIVEHMDQFPHDKHHIRLLFGLVPEFLYSWQNRYQFCLPSRFNMWDESGMRFKSTFAKTKKEKFYLQADVKSFPSHAHMHVKESILDFDVKPFSMLIAAADPTAPGTPKVSAVVSFTLIRHVVGVALTLLLPIYAIALVTPVCWFNEEFDNTAAYLATLLLTLVAHRSVIADRTQIVQQFTTVDFDFVYCLGLLIVQLMLSLAVHINGETGKDPIHVGALVLPIIWIFSFETALVVLWCAYRAYGVYATAGEVGHSGILDSTAKREPLTRKQYLELQSTKKCILAKLRPSALYQQFKKGLKVKTYFSTNLKLMLSKSQKDGFHGQTSSVPMNDLFRMRVTPEEAPKLVDELIKCGFCKFYTKKVSQGICKVVFIVEDSNLKTPLEVQVTNMDDDGFSQSHSEYKRTMLKRFVRSNRQRFTIKSLKKLYWQSWFINLFRCRCKSLSDDRELYGTLQAAIEHVDAEEKDEADHGVSERVSLIKKRNNEVQNIVNFIEESMDSPVMDSHGFCSD